MNDPIVALIKYFSQHLPLSRAESDCLEAVFRAKKVRRRQYLLQEGSVCQFNSFVVEGCFRMYMVDDSGKEHNLQFAVEDWWMIDMSSFYSGLPSKLNIEAMEHSVVLQIS